MKDFDWILLDNDFFIVQVKSSFNYSDGLMNRVDELWREEQQKRPGELFNGETLVLSGDEASRQLEESGRLNCELTEYRFFLAQLKQPGLQQELGLRALAVTGVVWVDDSILMGRRSTQITQDPGLWEVAPAGGLTAIGQAGERLDPVAQVKKELEEETNIPPSAIRSAIPKLLLIDRATRVHDIVVEVDLRIDKSDVLSLIRTRTNKEYSECRLVARSELDKFAGSDVISQASALLIELLLSGFGIVDG